MENLENKNYYELLGIRREASVEEIKEAYRDIARVFHPDSNFFDEVGDALPELSDGTSQVFKTVTAAYNTLVNAGKREEYDRSLPNVRPWEDVEELLRGGEVDWKTASELDLPTKRPRKDTGHLARGKFGVLEQERSEPVRTAGMNQTRTTKVHHLIRSNQKERTRNFLLILALVMGFTFLGVIGIFLMT